MKKHDIHQEITNQIISLLDTVNIQDYQAPFAGLVSQGMPINPTTKNHYKGVNILALWFNQQDKEFTSNKWATYKQWKEIGAQVRKGEKSSQIIFYKTLTTEEKNEAGDTEEHKIPMLKLYNVFNANQVDDFDDTAAITINDTDLVKPIEVADQFCKNTKADIRHGKTSAYYDPVADYIGIPDTIAFQDTQTASATENYYSTLLHELTHLTGSKRRLGRFKQYKENKQDYAFEELVAELGAAFMCASLNITQSGREDHAQYIKGWLKALKDDKRHIFKAAAQANKAVEYLNDLQKG